MRSGVSGPPGFSTSKRPASQNVEANTKRWFGFYRIHTRRNFILLSEELVVIHISTSKVDQIVVEVADKDTASKDTPN